MRMSRLATRLALAALLTAWLVGCGLNAREIPYALTHQIGTVPSESMSPTIKPGDRVAIKVGYYDDHPVQRFDIVAYEQNPEDVANGGGKIFIARVIGLGGDAVEFKGGQVFVNGSPLEQPFQTIPPLPPDPHRDPGRPWVKVPPGEYLLVGDNRANSYDGRYWGTPTLPKRYIHGKVVRIFPQQESGTPAPAAQPAQ
jgi:signal peptidase I